MKSNSTQLRFTLFFLLLLSGITGFAAKPPLKKVSIAAALPPTYCSASSLYSSEEYIYNVTFNGVDNISGRSQYTDFTSVVFNAARASANTVVMQIGGSWPDDRGYIWVDWNQDGDFDDTDETISVSGVGAGPYNATINVPETAVLGNTRMRIRLHDLTEGNTSACGNSYYGEVEDYTINVLQAPYCAAGTAILVEYISAVTFNGVTKTSGKMGYSDFTATIFNAVVGSVNSITINLTDSYPPNQGKVWVDWNRDSDFNDADESIPLTNFIGEGPYSGSITVPENAIAGPTRMRIRMFDNSQGGSHDSCGTAAYGEVEDYTINVLTRRYVKQGGTGDGLSWATASGNLQAMINNVAAGSEVWVATGDYQPAAGQSFIMKENVKIYGGFPATGNPAMADRNYNMHVTQLLGNGNRVIYNDTNGLTNLAVLDGFTVANGSVSGSGNHGGGISNFESYPVIQNCIFKNNSSGDRGGAMYNVYEGSTKVINCLFYNNMAVYGGATFDRADTNSHYINCTFSGNTAEYGGALYSSAGSDILAYNCIFWGNTANTAANEIYFSGSGASIFNCLINVTPQNVEDHIYLPQTNTISGDPQFVDVAAGDYRLKSNSPAINTGSNAYFTGVATAKDLANKPRIYETTIDIGAYEYQVTPDAAKILYVKKNATGNGSSWANALGEVSFALNAAKALNTLQPQTVTAIWVAAGNYQPAAGQSFAMVEDVKIYGGFPATGNPAMADRDYKVNVTQLLGNGNRVITNSNNGLTNLAVLDGFTVANGVVTGTGNHGGGIMNLNSNPIIQNCIFKNNSSADRGGALYNEVGYTTKVINCLFYNNTALYGGASFDIGGADTHYINCTFSNNTADYGGAVLTTANSNIMAYNCIFWGNTATTTANEIYLPGSTADIFNCLINVTPQNVAGGSNFTQTNTISGNPQFVDVAAGDYRLKSNSPAINTGSNTYYANAGTGKDLANKPRLYNNATIDIGAYEYQANADCSIPTTWNGTTWSNGTPTSYYYAAVIAGNYSSTGNIAACSLTVSSGTVVVNTGHNFVIRGAVAVNGGSLTFEDDANLLQEDDVANTGNITYKRNSNALHYLDYTMWSSPVTGTQKLKEFSNGTLDERFYVYNTTANAFSNYTSASGIFGSNPNAVTFAKAKGYLIRMPAGLSTTQTSVFNGSFIGIPNNGNISIALGTGGNRFNAVGNPYPSPISISSIIDANNTQLDNGTIYLWRKTNNSANPTYATVTKLAYNANSAEGGTVGGGFTGSPASWVLQAGQGFFVKASTTATALSFTNGMRRFVNTGPFFRMAQDTNDDTTTINMSRFWLDINNATGAFGQTVIGYTDATTKQLDYGWDGRLLNDGEIALYSVAENTKLAIQARDAFAATDVVQMGYKATSAGSLTISLNRKDGLFSDGQNIYLVDKLTNTTHDILQSAYTFTTQAGTFDERFDIVYANGTLGVDKPIKNDAGIVVYKNDNKLHITATNILKEIKVYDMRGRLLYSADALQASQHSIGSLNIAQQAIIIKIKTDDGIEHTRKTLY